MDSPAKRARTEQQQDQPLSDAGPTWDFLPADEPDGYDCVEFATRNWVNVQEACARAAQAKNPVVFCSALSTPTAHWFGRHGCKGWTFLGVHDPLVLQQLFAQANQHQIFALAVDPNPKGPRFGKRVPIQIPKMDHVRSLKLSHCFVQETPEVSLLELHLLDAACPVPPGLPRLTNRFCQAEDTDPQVQNLLVYRGEGVQALRFAHKTQCDYVTVDCGLESFGDILREAACVATQVSNVTFNLATKLSPKEAQALAHIKDINPSRTFKCVRVLD